MHCIALRCKLFGKRIENEGKRKKEIESHVTFPLNGAEEWHLTFWHRLTANSSLAAVSGGMWSPQTD